VNNNNKALTNFCGIYFILDLGDGNIESSMDRIIITLIAYNLSV